MCWGSPRWGDTVVVVPIAVAYVLQSMISYIESSSEARSSETRMQPCHTHAQPWCTSAMMHAMVPRMAYEINYVTGILPISTYLQLRICDRY